MKKLVDRIVFQGMESFGRHYSCYRGFVMSNEDPKKLDRLFVYVPHISGRNRKGNWAWPKGKPNEVSNLPKNGDMVWVEFESGDYRYPIWSFANQIKPIRELTNPPIKPGDYKIKTEKGHEILIDNEKDFIHLKLSDGSILDINKDGIDINTKGKLDIRNQGVSLSIILRDIVSALNGLIIMTAVGPGIPAPHSYVKFNEILQKINLLMK